MYRVVTGGHRDIFRHFKAMFGSGSFCLTLTRIFYDGRQVLRHFAMKSVSKLTTCLKLNMVDIFGPRARVVVT